MGRKPPRVTAQDLETPAGRRRAWAGLLLSDHGLLRYLYSNIHQISPRMWRSFQPAPFHLRRFKKMGVQTVVNLRGPSDTGFYQLEKEACEQLGLTLIDFKVYSRDTPSKEALHSARELFQRIDYPAVMHCKSGSDRVGFMSALYLFVHENRPLADALQQLSLRYGHVRQGKTGVIDHFFDAYKAYNAETPTPFYDWVDRIYDPAATKASFMESWWGSLLTERVLRRE
ncbi:MAG: tyrosine-protein phosphatase [Pseudomonadota bacterium]